MRERWRPVRGFEGCYEVSDQGRVRSLRRLVRGRGGCPFPVKERILRPYVNKRTGHVTVTLGGDDNRRPLAHMVLETFVGPRPEGTRCRYINGQPTDCRLENLCWAPARASQREQTQGRHKLTPAAVVQIRSMAGTMPQREIAALFAVAQTTISNVVRGKTWAL